MIAPTLTPAPIPPFAPVESPAGVSDGSRVSGTELDGIDASLVVVKEADAVEDVTSVVVDAVSVVDWPLNIVPTTSYRVAFRFHVAQTSGSDGSTLNLPTPLLQQLVLWSQQ